MALSDSERHRSSSLRSSSRSRSRHRSSPLPLQEQHFSSYLTFGYHATLCLGLFVVAYVFVMLSFAPLLSQQISPTQHSRDLTASEVLRPVMDPLMENINININPLAAIKKHLQRSRTAMGLTDAALLHKAVEEIENVRKKRHGGGIPNSMAFSDQNINNNDGKRLGFIVLGMHRSGTSMLAGLLVMGSGYHTGGPLIESNYDNEKGFFERLDVVLQNDEFMNRQKVWWSANVINYNDTVAWEDKKTGRVRFFKGQRALQFFNNPANAPWLQKDPRMCITLKTWLPLFNSEPAVIFTYRHPLEVALSLKKREHRFTLEHGLRLWIIYNMRALQNSEHLCRVYSSNDAVIHDTWNEIHRITNELTTKCGVPPPPRQITLEGVERFVDPNLQHNQKSRSLQNTNPVIQDYNGCLVHSYQSALPEGTPDFDREKRLYLIAMKMYCDMQTGAAYQSGYAWPEIR